MDEWDVHAYYTTQRYLREFPYWIFRDYFGGNVGWEPHFAQESEAWAEVMQATEVILYFHGIQEPRAWRAPEDPATSA